MPVNHAFANRSCSQLICLLGTQQYEVKIAYALM